MTAPLMTIDLRPTSELMLVLDAIVGAFNRLSGAIEASNKIAGSVALSAPDPRAPGTGEGAEHASPVPITSRHEVMPAIVAAEAPAMAPDPIATRPPVAEDYSPAQTAALDTRMFTPERNAILRRDYPAGVSIEVILQRLHTLPGRTVPRDRVAIQAGRLGFNRGGLIKPAQSPEPQAPVVNRMDVLKQVAAAIDAKAAVAAPILSAIDPGPAVSADFEQVRRWAAERGIGFGDWDDLPPVNSRRERLGLSLFKRQFPVKGVWR